MTEVLIRYYREYVGIQKAILFIYIYITLVSYTSFQQKPTKVLYMRKNRSQVRYFSI